MEEKEFLEHIRKNILIPKLDRIASVRGDLARLCERLERDFGFANAKHRLAELRNNRGELTHYYLSILIDGGVMDINDILQGRKLEDLPECEKLIAMRYALTREEILEAWRNKEKKVILEPTKPGNPAA